MLDCPRHPLSPPPHPCALTAHAPVAAGRLCIWAMTQTIRPAYELQYLIQTVAVEQMRQDAPDVYIMHPPSERIQVTEEVLTRQLCGSILVSGSGVRFEQDRPGTGKVDGRRGCRERLQAATR